MTDSATTLGEQTGLTVPAAPRVPQERAPQGSAAGDHMSNDPHTHERPACAAYGERTGSLGVAWPTGLALQAGLPAPLLVGFISELHGMSTCSLSFQFGSLPLGKGFLRPGVLSPLFSLTPKEARKALPFCGDNGS